jgi:two-component system, OmpR family, response regulator
LANLLLVDDDAHIREVMRFALEKAGHQVTEAADGAAAYALFQGQGSREQGGQQQPFDLVVLDIVMPELDGLELCRRIRAHGALPIIFVSSRDEELDRVLGLELGGDDYLTKPFSPRELSARVAAVLRRGRSSQLPPEARPPAERQRPEVQGKPEPEPALRHRGVVLDRSRHQCWVGERELILTVSEFELFRVLLEAPGRVFSRAQLVEQAYGAGHFISDRTVDSHIRRLRQKLDSEADQVETVYGVGYRLRE